MNLVAALLSFEDGYREKMLRLSERTQAGESSERAVAYWQHYVDEDALSLGEWRSFWPQLVKS